MTVYLDASALVKLIAHEAESAALLAWLRNRPSQATSVVGLVEVRRAAARHGGVPPERLEAVLARVASVGLDAGIVASAGSLGPAGLRTLDAIHLASAALLGPDLEAVATYDRRLGEAAAALGLPVASPGS